MLNDGIYYVTSIGTNKALDVPSGSKDNGVILQQYDQNAGQNQKWQFTYLGQVLGEDAYKITSVASNKVVDLPGGSLAGGQTIQQYDDIGGTNQRWLLTLWDGNYVIKSESSQLVLDVPGGSLANGVQIQQYQFNGGFNQQWNLISTN